VSRPQGAAKPCRHSGRAAGQRNCRPSPFPPKCASADRFDWGCPLGPDHDDPKRPQGAEVRPVDQQPVQPRPSRPGSQSRATPTGCRPLDAGSRSAIAGMARSTPPPGYPQMLWKSPCTIPPGPCRPGAAAIGQKSANGAGRAARGGFACYFAINLISRAYLNDIQEMSK